MSDRLERLARSIAALCLAVGIVTFAVTLPAQGASAALCSPAPVTITIQAPASIAAGANLCFEVTCYGGDLSVLLECNDVKIPVTVTPTHDPLVMLVCGKVPAAAAGSNIIITAASSTGGVATATVAVH